MCKAGISLHEKSTLYILALDDHEISEILS